MTKSTMATKLPRKLEQKMQTYGSGSGDRKESDDPLYDAVKLGLDNAGNTVLGWNIISLLFLFFVFCNGPE